MTVEWFLARHDVPELLEPWLADLGVRDAPRAARSLRDLVRKAPTALDSIARLAVQLNGVLPHCPDPTMALVNLERFLAASPLETTLYKLATNPRTTEILLQVVGSSQHYSEILIRDPGLLDWLRGGAERRDRSALVEDLWSMLEAAADEAEAAEALGRFRLRESLRIGYNDIVRGLPLEMTTSDLSDLADACVEASIRLARSRLEPRHGVPRSESGATARFVVLGLGKLGGRELNYSSDIDLIFLYDHEGMTSGPRVVSNAEYFARLGSEILKLLSRHSALGMVYRVDMRLRPDGEQGALARSLDATVGYYVTRGRTWERQALIKCRAIAGDLELGLVFRRAITPFIHRRYLGAAEIAEIKALKRKIEQRTVSEGTAEVEVKTGTGGIRDVEFVVQFLQLLHGGEYPEVREGNTLRAMALLEQVGCLTAEERHIMDDTYRFLRKLEHRLQIVLDRQTHQMPRDLEQVRTLALRMGYALASPWEERSGPAQRFLGDYRAKTELNRRILNHLLHDAFSGDPDPAVDLVVDLVLDPDPSPESVRDALAPYPFRDPAAAYHNLMALAHEDVPFLSQARCRHFLAAIAPRLLTAVGKAADPDLTLTNLEKVSGSLGAKAVLWELFNFNPPSLRLYVEICANSQFLSEILINNPGMIDDLIDSLVVDRAMPGGAIRAELAELCKGAVDLAPILWSYRNKEWIRIGARDILGREPIREVTRELADVAQAIVVEVARDVWRKHEERYGSPRSSAGKRDRWAILALGKFGGRELNYHSDLDLVFLHESDGKAVAGESSISSEQFVTGVAQRILKSLAAGAGAGALYHVDARLRPHGSSGPLVLTLDAFTDYLRRSMQTWERLALTRGRVIHATGGFGQPIMQAIHQSLSGTADAPRLAEEVRSMRRRLEASSKLRHDLKRGAGGLADLEFIVQFLQLAHAAQKPDVLRCNFWDALQALRSSGVIDAADHHDLRVSYNFLRTVEGRLRLIQNRGVAGLPDDPAELERLAVRLNYEAKRPEGAVEAFLDDASRTTERVRELFDRLVR